MYSTVACGSLITLLPSGSDTTHITKCALSIHSSMELSTRMQIRQPVDHQSKLDSLHSKL